MVAQKTSILILKSKAGSNDSLQNEPTMTSLPRVKICCISSPQEAQLAIQYGAAALGLVGPMPSGPGIIDDALIHEITRGLPPAVSSFLLTSETSATGIIEHHRRVRTSTIQIVDELKEGSYEQIREALPSIKLVQVIHVIDEQSVEEAIRLAPQVDGLLLDSGNPSAAIKTLGGTGKVHNWDLSKRICEAAEAPVFLAGGLNAQNVQEAIQHVQPYGLDLCSSVRTDGKLDAVKLRAFFAAVQGQG